jgi:hypothetical protein
MKKSIIIRLALCVLAFSIVLPVISSVKLLSSNCLIASGSPIPAPPPPGFSLLTASGSPIPAPPPPGFSLFPLSGSPIPAPPPPGWQNSREGSYSLRNLMG